MAHARLSPSGAERWMNCPGSVVLEEGCADSTSEYADEGTAAHALAAMCLTERKDAIAFSGRRLAVINGVYWPGLPAPVPPKLKGHTEEIKNFFDVDADMVENVQVYLDNILQYVADTHELFVEQRLPIGHITGEDGAEGTGDTVIIADNGAELQLHDLKYGRGHAVRAERNKQLMLYGLGALKLADILGYAPSRVRLVIHQPRINRAPDEWCCTVEELHAFAAEVGKAGERCQAALTYAGKFGELHEKYIRAGDDQCKWCRAKATCSTLAAFVTEAVGADFEAIPTTAGIAAIEKLDLPPDVLGLKLDAVDMIEDWCKAVRAETERRLIRGEAVPSPKGGYKLVAGKKGRRSWIDEEAVIKRLKGMRLKQDEMYDFKLISPTTAEKLLKPTPKRWDALQEHIGQSEGKPHVAPTTDPRPALAVQPVDEMFSPAAAVAMEDLA